MKSAAISGALGGVFLAAAIGVFHAARAAYTMTRQHSWYQLKKL
ncbi:membrane protein [Arthrobacter phage Sarge]|uniref:Membrane protein n=1 Tax=Arthrobacter phage Sarge TaxID=2885974 RepID=A0AAE8Y6G0_9CAUD|nr:membrane protein [Arthrobacter phage Sarge]UDL14870.1 membrane protein [Arthrobacter phage Sarge]